MEVIDIIAEEVQRLFQQKTYTISELAAILERSGHDEYSIEALASILLNAYKRGGDPAVIKAYAEMSGVQIEAVTNGRYMFANLVDPEKLSEIEDNAFHTPDEMPS